jgi:hypothetical protein
MKWDELEKLIIDKRDEFDGNIPVEGHEGHFLSKLDQYHKKVASKNRIYLLKIAASVGIFIISSVFVLWAYFQYSYKPKMQFNITRSVIEFREAQDYLASQIDIGVEQLKKIKFYEPNQMDSIFADLNAMDFNNNQLQADLKLNPNDDRLMNAIIDLYLIKLDVINQIIQSFSISETKEKTNGYEHDI